MTPQEIKDWYNALPVGVTVAVYKDRYTLHKEDNSRLRWFEGNTQHLNAVDFSRTFQDITGHIFSDWHKKDKEKLEQLIYPFKTLSNEDLWE